MSRKIIGPGTAALGGLCMIVGFFLPWSGVHAPAEGGMQAIDSSGYGHLQGFHGWATLVLGAALLGTGVAVWVGKRLRAWVLSIPVALAVVISIADFTYIQRNVRFINLLPEATGLPPLASMGAGIWMVAAGAALGVAGVALLLIKPGVFIRPVVADPGDIGGREDSLPPQSEQPGDT